MRISDWSSDVCSSDLQRIAFAPRQHPEALHQQDRGGRGDPPQQRGIGMGGVDEPVPDVEAEDQQRKEDGPRSEEHTSELQSLMRISYAVFCLKKTKTPIRTKTTDA